MSVEQILGELSYAKNHRRFPRRALEHAIAAREEITPHLLSALEETRNRNRELAEESGYMAHLYAGRRPTDRDCRGARPLRWERRHLAGFWRREAQGRLLA